MKHELEDLYRKDPRHACKLALRRTRKVAWRDRLDTINKLLHAYGTEAIRGSWQNGYWCDIVACYVNMGDTYATTVIHVRTNSFDVSGRFIISSWGDFVEHNSKRLEIK